MVKTAYEMTKKATLKWREANQERYNGYHRNYSATYYETHKEQVKEKQRQRREKKRIFEEQWKILRNIDIF